ncbi:MAG: prolyl-tRNA synthetase associated domain-containing protein [Deltaproteobacteria bacterium]|nr:prolyl-tRNA synthetase associated domain-containing protein [Deltaproteobacteria bacterium]
MIFDFLSAQNIPFQRVDHPAVFTCEEADALVPPLGGSKTKNLFLRDGKGQRHFLVSTTSQKAIDLKALSKLLEVSGLGFASPERLAKFLKLTPGSVTLLGVLNDEAKQVQVVIDRELWDSGALQCHPLVNTSTILIRTEDLERFFKLTGHAPRILALPEKLKE